MSQELSLIKTIAIFGATSDIAIAVARHYAKTGWRLVLAGRDAAALLALEADVCGSGAAGTHIMQVDFARLEDLATLVQESWDRFGGIDVALIAYGTTPVQEVAERNPMLTAVALTVNFISPAILLNELAGRFEARGGGTIVAITSVAGDRGRRSNYIYGAAKGGLQRLMQGLRHRLSSSGVAVLDVRPGFVRTKMNMHRERRGLLWAGPDRVAADIVAAIQSGRAVCYTPGFWRLIMLVVRAMPRFVSHRTNF
jgi:short-subunit dehydrogenase